MRLDYSEYDRWWMPVLGSAVGLSEIVRRLPGLVTLGRRESR